MKGIPFYIIIPQQLLKFCQPTRHFIKAAVTFSVCRTDINIDLYLLRVQVCYTAP